MADYQIGLDFGTSQTKICLLNKEYDQREFIRFENGSYFLPSVIVKGADGTFSYGNESENGFTYRYFKMAAAEDHDLLRITNEDFAGNLPRENIDEFRNYSFDYDIKPEVLVVLFLTYIYLFIKEKKGTQNRQNFGGALGGFFVGTRTTQNTFSINLGIPTEWNNPNHIKRKIKFQSLLISSIELASQFDNLNVFLQANEIDLITKINQKSQSFLSEFINKDFGQREIMIKSRLKELRLSVFPESAAGVNYLLKTKRLENGYYTTLDIGAGTSDIAIFQVHDNRLARYFCSESIALASNDVYREYAYSAFIDSYSTFEGIKKAENEIRLNLNVKSDSYKAAFNLIKGARNGKGIEFVIGKTLYKQYFLPYRSSPFAQNIFSTLNNGIILIFGGGANLKGFCEYDYIFLQGNDVFGNNDKILRVMPIENYISQVNIIEEQSVKNDINLLVLALGLTYVDVTEDYIPFSVPRDNIPVETSKQERYFYYDLQEAAYK